MRHKHHIDATRVTGETRRRGWGPFSGAQLTVIIVAVVVMILLPVGAFAVVSGTNSFITDATTGKRAKVTSTGQLQTHPNGPLTVNGAVTATPSPAGSTFATGLYLGFTTADYQTIASANKTGKALVITSITVGTVGTYGDPVMVTLNRTLTIAGRITLNPGAPPVTLSYPSGFGIMNGSTLSAAASSYPVNLNFTLNGYWVPAAQCTLATCG